jgi:hypothetical protein
MEFVEEDPLASGVPHPRQVTTIASSLRKEMHRMN